jgi:hypothetical protein
MTELVWRGKYLDGRRVEPSREPAPITPRERHGEGPGEPDLLIEGDRCVALASLLPTHAAGFQAVYIDPPFDTGGRFEATRRLDDGATCVARRPLHEIYAHHLYEPGPAKLLLMRALAQFGDEVVFRTHDGAQIGTQEMLRRLDEDDPIALEFVRDMHAAALASLRVRARRDAGSS